ncbi:MAG: glycoside hydrolase family 2 protein [Bacteroidia bacterium]|nr:glycoside hydrolase family 2 protein [Bacteroidia bacterium]
MKKFHAFLIPGLTFLAFFIACNSDSMNFSRIPINSRWEFRKVDENTWLPATVPGTVHSDLLHLQKIPDPQYRMQEKEVQWIEEEDWEYKTTFSVDRSVRDMDVTRLKFHGLDTYTDVFLNDSLILSSDNMFRVWEVDVKPFLKPGNNDLSVYFHSPIKEGMKKFKATPYLIPATNELAPQDRRTSVHTRKAPYHYGWDWGQRLVTSGIWRPVELIAWNYARIEDVRFEVKSISTEKAQYQAIVNISALVAEDLELEVWVNDLSLPVATKTISAKPGSLTAELPFDILKPELWWPNGLGEQPLYDITFRLSAEGKFIHSHKEKIGVREVKLVQKPDPAGSSFHFEVNGIPVFMKGANYIPPHNLNPTVTTQQYRRVIQAAVDANMNMLRVWGGAIYENDEFYNLCDENGILIWQDFMFACAMYPADEGFIENVKQEAVDNIKRLRNHPCLALYCGNNENLTAWHKWNWQTTHNLSPEDSAELWHGYERVFYEVLPEAIQTYDPERFFWPSSPSSAFKELANHISGDEHDWRIWFQQKPFDTYKENTARFVSEYGLQAYPDMRTIRAFTEEGDRDMDSEVMRHRQRSFMPYIAPGFSGNDMILYYVKEYFPDPKDFAELVYFSQLTQKEALKTGTEAHRRNKPYTMGSLYWQIDDCWPTMSWASTDYFGRWKASHYAVKKSYAEVIVSPTIDDGQVRVYVVSDRMTPVEAELEIKLMDFYGKILFSQNIPVECYANSSRYFFEKPVETLVSAGMENRVIMTTNLREKGEVISENILYFARPKVLDLPEATLNTKVSAENDGYTVEVSSNVFAKGVHLDVEEIEGFFSDNYFDLLPGEIRKVTFTPTTLEAGTSLTITARAVRKNE